MDDLKRFKLEVAKILAENNNSIEKENLLLNIEYVNHEETELAIKVKGRITITLFGEKVIDKELTLNSEKATSNATLENTCVKLGIFLEKQLATYTFVIKELQRSLS